MSNGPNKNKIKKISIKREYQGVGGVAKALKSTWKSYKSLKKYVDDYAKKNKLGIYKEKPKKKTPHTKAIYRKGGKINNSDLVGFDKQYD